MLVIFLRELLYIKWSVRECKKILLAVTCDIKWRFSIVFTSSLFCGTFRESRLFQATTESVGFQNFLFRSTFLASRTCLKSLEHLPLHIHLIYEEFPKNLKHKYLQKNLAYIEYDLTVIPFLFFYFFFSHTFKKFMSSVYTGYLSILAKSIPHPALEFSSLHYVYLIVHASAWVLKIVRFNYFSTPNFNNCIWISRR